MKNKLRMDMEDTLMLQVLMSEVIRKKATTGATTTAQTIMEMV